MKNKHKRRIRKLEKRVSAMERGMRLEYERNDALTKIVTSEIKTTGKSPDASNARRGE